MILPPVSTLARAMSRRGRASCWASTSAWTARASASLSVTSTGLASRSCSAWLSRSAATQAGLQHAVSQDQDLAGAAIMSMPTLP